MPQGSPMPGEKYLHFKKKLYQIIAIAYHSETMEKLVVYQALYGDFKVYVRPYEMFISEVDRKKYPEVLQTYRFQLLDWENEQLNPQRDSAELKEMRSTGQDSAVSREVRSTGQDSAVSREVRSTEQDSVASRQESSAPQVPITPAVELVEDSDASEIDPLLIEFLDAETFSEKAELLSERYGELTDKLIDDMAISLDLVIEEGPLQDRFRQLKQCIRTQQKYERR